MSETTVAAATTANAAESDATDPVAEALGETVTGPTVVDEPASDSTGNNAAEPVQVTEPAPSAGFQAAADEADEILDALMSRISSVTAATRYLKILVFGQPGTTKTSFAGTAPKPLFVDVERGTTSLLNQPETRHVDVLEFRSIRQVELLISKMSEGNNPLDKYETLVIDSFSELQKRDLDDIVKKAAMADASRNPYLPIGPDYNINTEHMRQVADALKSLNKHIIVTCHVKEEKDDTTGRVLLRPNLTPKLAGSMNGLFDVVAYMDVDRSGGGFRRTLQVHPTPNVSAKCRIGGLSAVIEDPKFDDLLNALNATVNQA